MPDLQYTKYMSLCTGQDVLLTDDSCDEGKIAILFIDTPVLVPLESHTVASTLESIYGSRAR